MTESDTARMAREAGLDPFAIEDYAPALARFEALVRADVWERAAVKVEMLVDRWADSNPLLPPPYPRSYLNKAAHELRMEIPSYAEGANAQAAASIRSGG